MVPNYIGLKTLPSTRLMHRLSGQILPESGIAVLSNPLRESPCSESYPAPRITVLSNIPGSPNPVPLNLSAPWLSVFPGSQCFRDLSLTISVWDHKASRITKPRERNFENQGSQKNRRTRALRSHAPPKPQFRRAPWVEIRLESKTHRADVHRAELCSSLAFKIEANDFKG